MRSNSCLPALALFAALASACSSAKPSSNAGGDEPTPGEDAVVTPFDKTAIYFTGSDNKRIVDMPASFPKTGEYSRIMLHLALECPSGGCDPWDRFGSLGVVTAKGTDDQPDTVIEVMRFITPFHVGASWDLDVTELRPLLSGEVTMRAFIDTWVGPGSQYGDGWLLSASFEMTGGIPEKIPTAVVPVWIQRNAVYGDPAKPLADSVPAQSLALPKGSAYALRSFVTGHGQGNANNCAEFCSRTHTITAGSTPYSQEVWRTDCKTTAAPNQQGTYQYSRSGWCPGADVKPWVLDVTSDVSSAAEATFAYEIEEYENTCRPDASTCSGCTLGTSCDYDGGAHTEPYFAISTALIAYR
jgi:hypothetical protein